MQDPTKPPVDQELSLEDFEEQVRAQAGIRPDVWKGMMAQESAGGRKTTSPTGVKGRWQVTEAVAKQYGLDRNNPFHQATAAARYLKDQYDGLKHVKDDDERWLSAVARYYGGPDAVSKDGTVSNVSRDGYSTPAVHIQRVAEKMAEAAKSSPSPTFQSEGAAPPAQTPAKTQPPVARRMKTESEYPVLRAPSDVSTALFDWRSGGTQGILADSARNAEVVKEAQRNQSPQRQRERASAVASGQNALERGASQFFNAAAKGVVRIPQGVAELSDLVNEYQPATHLGNVIQGIITGQKPQRLAPQIAPYTQQVEAAIDRDVPVDANDPSWVTAKIPRAVGGLAPFIAGGAVSGGSRAVTGLLGAAGNAGDIGKEFDEAGGDPANRDKAIALAAATGLSEVLGVGKLLAKFGTNQGVMQAAKTVLEEGGQEAFQQWVNNLNAANVGAYDPNRSQLEGVGEAAALGGLLGGGLSGVSNIAARRAQQSQIDRAPAPIAPVAPRSADTNLNPDEVLTPATGAQPIIDPVTGIPQSEASNPATDAKVEDIFAHPLFGRKPNPAAEKAKVKAQEAQAYRQAATEAAAAGDVGRQMDALQEALQRESDPQARLDLKAQLRALEPAPATRKLSGQRAPETAALPEDAADAPTAGLTGDLMSPQEVKAAAPVAGVLGTLQQYKGEVPTLIAAGKFNEAKALIKEMDAFLKVERKKAPPEALSSEYGQRILKDGRELGALRDMLANRMQAVAAEKAATPAKAPRAATPKTPKGPKVVTPKAEGVRRGQGVLSGVTPDQIELIGNPLAEENQSGGIPPVEPVAGNVLPFEELADRAKAKVNKRANMSPVEYLKQASQGEGFRVTDSGEAEGVSAKDAKIVAFTNQNSQYGMNDAAVMLDEGGYFLPDGRRFTDQDVKEADVLDYLKQYGKQSSAGNTGGVDPRIAAEEAAYYEQQAASEGAPTTSTRLPSGLIAESRRPQPIETPRSTPDYRQKALDRINATELPDNAKQRYRDWLEQGRLTDSDVLNDPDLAPAAQPTPAEQVQEVEMRRTGTDNAPVVEMPKRATPPQPIPEELSRVYGGKITPEQAEAIQRRRDLRESVDKGAYGKFSAIARRSFASEATGEDLPPLAAHPEIRRILGLPEMPSYKVEDGRVSNNWQKATQHTMDALAEMVGIERSSLSDIDALHELQSAIARRSSNQSLHEVFAATMAGTDMALQRADVLLSHPAVESVIEKILDRQASSGKSLGNRGSLREELQEALATAQDEANKTGTPVYNYDKEDIAAITEGAIKAFEADIGTRRVLEGRPQEYLAKLYASRNRSADASGKQSAASPAESPAGRAPAPAQESPRLQAPTEIVEPRVGGYVRKGGRIYEITKYHPKEDTVWIQEPGSPGAQAIPRNKVRELTIPDDVAKAEIGEAAKEGRPGQNQPKTSGRKEKAPSQIEYRGSLLNPIEEISKVIKGFKKLAATLSGRNPSKLYKLPVDLGKLRAEIDDVVKTVQRYAKAREDAGLPIEPELAKSLSDSAQKIATAFQSGDQKGYQNARKAIDDAFVKYGVEAPSFASTRREALKTWEKYQKAQEAAGKPLSKEYAAALIDIEQRLRFANRDGDVQAYQKAKRDLNWLTQKIEAKEDPATLGDRLLTLRAGAHFLNPKFVIRNVLSQPIVWGGDKIDNAVAATISKLAAAVRGKKAVIGVDDFSTLTALNEGRKLALQERRDGKSIDPLYGLHPHAFEGKAGRALEDALFFINRLPDDAFYHGYFTAKLNDLAQRYKGSKDVSLDQLINQAHLESNKLAMRDKNWVSESLKRMQHGLNRLSTFNKSEKVGLGTLIVNYPQYPGSALKRAMEHSPLGLIDVAIEASKPGPFRERNVINALSKTLTGSAFTFGMGTLLGASGILTQGLTDDRRDDRRLREIGYRPYQLNTSALSRWFNGGFQQQRYADGDKLVSIDWAQPFAMLLAAGAATSYAWNREMSKTDAAKETGQAIYDSVASFMSTLGDQSVVKNLTHYKDTYDRAVEFKEDGIAATAKDIADDIVSSNVPVLLNQIRQWLDPVDRSTWAQEADEKGKLVRKEGLSGFLEETFIRRPQSRLPIVAEKGIPGVMRGLPAFPGSRKQTTYTPQPENNSFFNAFVSPSNVSTVRPVDQSDRKLLDSLSQPRKEKEKKRKSIETVEPGK